MKKNFFVFFIICTSLSYGTTLYERTDLNIIINSKNISLSIPAITYNNYTLLPVRNILSFFNIPNENISYLNESISLKNHNSILTLSIGDINGYIDGNKIQLPVSPVIYKNTTYLPLRVISDFFDCYIHYDNESKSIFIKDINEYKQIESFFQEVNNNLNSVDSIQIDIINEIKNNTSSYSFGNSILMDKTSNTILEKNILSSNWEENKIKLTPIINKFYSNFFVGLSFDKNKSSKNQLVFYGYYPTKSGILCKATIYVDLSSLLITKQTSEYILNNMQVKQNVLYSYN